MTGSGSSLVGKWVCLAKEVNGFRKYHQDLPCFVLFCTVSGKNNNLVEEPGTEANPIPKSSAHVVGESSTDARLTRT